ncbi:MAG TPA: methyl-accepting chemotaxis protein [Bryobacteraceae bacterium]|nr:methyl-accepting chemotaxis protein [Bryobacteraceae bacterium]
MKLSTKLTGGAGMLSGIALLLGVCSIFWTASLNKSMQYSVNVAAKRRLIASGLYSSTLLMQSLDRDIVLRSILQQASGAQGDRQKYETVISEVRKDLADYQSLIEDDSMRRGYDAIQSDMNQLFQIHEELLRAMDQQQFEQVQKIADEKAMPRADAIIDASQKLMSEENARMSAASDDGSAKASIAVWVSILLTIIGLAVSGLVIVVVRKVSSALLNLASVMSGGAEQVASAATQVSAVSQSLAQASSEQAASLEETSASGHDLASMTRRNLDDAKRASESALETDRQLNVANETLGNMVGSMNDINTSSKKISRIIRVIDEIAFQTNILALNAAVEAARAGEAGMGFAVVADEVRSLAQRCARAAQDTSALIEESIQTVDGGSAKLTLVVQAIEGIAQQAASVRELMTGVNNASQEQSRHIDQISSSVAQMQKVTQNTAASAEQGAAASEEMARHAESMRSSVNELQALVSGTGGSVSPAVSAKKRPVVRSAARRITKTAAAPEAAVRAHASARTAELDFPLDDGKFSEF